MKNERLHESGLAKLALGHPSCRLSYVSEGKEEVVEVTDAPLLMGRAYDVDMILCDESISRHHAKIVPDDEGWEIIDLESKNGVKVNTVKVERQLLQDGDCVDIGAIRIFIDIGTPAALTEASVIFREDEESSDVRTEMIDMDHFDLLFSQADGLERDSGPGTQAAWPGSAPGGGAGAEESANLLRLVSNAAEALLACESLDETLEQILTLIFARLPVERGVICLYDEKSDSIYPRVMRTLEGVPDEAVVISNRIARSAIEQKKSILVQDTMMDARFGGADSIVMMNIHSAMCAPLYRAERVVGVIYVDRCAPQDPFQTPHLQALSALANLSAIAVEQRTLRAQIREGEEQRERLERYSSPAVVKRILETPREVERDMVVEEGDVSVLFADLTDFTSMAENLRPSEVIHLLNHVFERLSSAVFDYEGTLDKFSGDGMMAFFGAPLAQEDHAERAVLVALRMQALLSEINANAHNRRYMSMRIGINSGPVVVGDIGSPQRRDYTVVGDVVNIAARLESSVAQPGQVVIGPRTFRQAGPLFTCKELDEVRLKGRIRTVRPYLVLGRKNANHLG